MPGNEINEIQFGQTVYAIRDNGAVRDNQGSGNAGKALGIDSNGDVIPMPFTGDDFTGATAIAAGAHGYVPAPAAGDQSKYLKGDGTWGVVDANDFTGATSSEAGAHGLVPAPSAGDQNKILCGDGTWMAIPDGLTALFTDVSFSIAATDWTLSSGKYNYTFSNSLITSASGVQVSYDDSFRTALTGDIYIAKNTGNVVFTTTGAPAATLTGTLRIFSSVSGTVPVSKGGTGAVTAKGARQNLNVSIRPIPIIFSAVSSLPQTVYDDDITSDMVPTDWVFSNPSAVPNGVECITANGSVTISLPTGGSISGETNILFGLVNQRTSADGATGQNQEQYAGDYVQIGAQTLTAEQKTQVQTNIGAASQSGLNTANAAIGKVSFDLTGKTNYTGDVYSIPDGTYRVGGAATNLPVAHNGFVFSIVRADGSKCLQYFDDNGDVWTNVKTSSTWGGWNKLSRIKYKTFEMETADTRIRLENYGVSRVNYINAFVTSTNGIACIMYTYSTYGYIMFVNMSTWAIASGTYSGTIVYYE